MSPGDSILSRAATLRSEFGSELSDHVAESFFTEASAITSDTVQREGERSRMTLDRAIDRVLTSRALGFPVMFLMLWGVFWLTIAGANYPSSVLAWLTFLVLVGFYFHEVLQEQHNPNRDPESRLGEGGATEVVLLRNKFGHYVTQGEINGRSVVFMVDTGATGVAVPLQGLWAHISGLSQGGSTVDRRRRAEGTGGDALSAGTQLPGDVLGR